MRRSHPSTRTAAKYRALQMAYADWLHIFNVNLFACMALVQGLRDPLETARGTVVNMTSIVGSRVHPFASAAYAASKAALWAVTRELAADLGPAGVRVNAVSPGEIDTGILSPGTRSIVENDIPLHRLGKPREVADLLLFLCGRVRQLYLWIRNPYRRRAESVNSAESDRERQAAGLAQDRFIPA